MKNTENHKILVTVATLFGTSILFAPLASASVESPTRLTPSSTDHRVEPIKLAQNSRDNNSRRDRGDRSRERQRDRNRGQQSQDRQRNQDRGQSRQRSRDRGQERQRNRERSRHREHSRGRNLNQRRNHNQRHNSRYDRRHDRRHYNSHRRHHNSYRRHHTNYRSNLGINFFFGTPGYSTHRWASSPYSFYRPGYWSYHDYQASTFCERINIEANHYDHTEIISVKQCYNPYDGTYIIQGSERIVDCPYANTRW